MRKYRLLTVVLLKELGASFAMRSATSKASKKTTIGIYALWLIIGVSMLPMMYLFYQMYQGLYGFFAPLEQLAFVTGAMFNLLCIVIFVLAMFSTPAIFYFSKDIEYLLPLPLTPAQIIGAKFTVLLLIEYVVAFFFVAPMFVVYAQYANPAVLLLQMLPAFLTLPVLPLAYSVVVVMVLMRVSAFGRNRDRYTLVVSLIGIFIGMGFGIFSSRMSAVDPEQLLALLNGNPGVMLTLNTLFFHVNFAATAVAELNWAAQMVNLALTAGVVAVFLLLAQFLYFKGVIGMSESAAPAKKMTQEAIARDAKSSHVFTAYLLKEFRLLFRSPTALLNCVLMVFLMPVLLFVTTVMQLGSEVNLSHYTALMDFTDPATVSYVLVGATASGFLLATMNLVSATAISREGGHFFVMKYLPVSYRTQLNAKAASGLMISAAGVILMLAILQSVFRAPVMLLLGAAVLTVPGCVFLNYFGLWVDLLRPKLVWDNEQMAIKQNLNPMIVMLVGMLISGGVAVAGFFWLRTPLLAFVVLLLGGGLPAVGMYLGVTRTGTKQMARL